MALLMCESFSKTLSCLGFELRLTTSLTEALALWQSSEFARRVFGDEVVEHYANMATVELAAFGRSVTDWERYRGFERL